jgi:hypothetical protein
MFADFPTPESCLFREFSGDGFTTSGSSGCSTLHIPAGASMLFALMIGGGGSGGSGFTGAAGTARGGGGGGGSGALTRILIPTKTLPSTIYVRPGQGSVRSAGSSATPSVLTLFPGANVNSSAIEDVIALASGGNNGGNGSGTAGGTGGGGGAAMATNSATLSQLGFYQSIGGQSGTAGGAQTGAAGATLTWGTGGIPISGGAGGGGVGTANTDFAGGAITGNIGASRYPGMPTIVAGVAAAGRGNNGMSFRYGRGPLRGCGASGGGTAGAAGTGGQGGEGGFGSGGGGGGGGVTGGDGGNGGPGWIGIWIW